MQATDMSTSRKAAQDDYVISLEAFEGPLDLLLFLIRRAEVDIQDIPIAAITDQYLLVLQQVDEVDIEQAGEFLVMAATLIELKSRTLSPPVETGEDGEGEEGEPMADPRQELVRQLLTYQRIRTAGEDLDEARVAFARRARARVRPSDDVFESEDDGLELDDLHLMDLVESWERIAQAIDFDQLGASHLVSVDDAPIALYQEDLLDRLERRKGMPVVLQETFAGKTAAQRVGLFLAVLELVKTSRVNCAQEGWGEPITIELTTASDEMLEEPAEVPDSQPPGAAQPPTESGHATAPDEDLSGSADRSEDGEVS